MNILPVVQLQNSAATKLSVPLVNILFLALSLSFF